MTLKCDDCGKECEVIVEDASFDHEFGIEKIFIPISECCHGGVIDTDTGKHVSQDYFKNIPWEE